MFPEKVDPMQWHAQAGNITTNIKVKADFTLPALNVTNVVKWKFHVDDSAKVSYDIILVLDILTELGLNLKCSEHIIEEYGGPFKGSKTPMDNLGMYIFKDLNTDKI